MPVSGINKIADIELSQYQVQQHTLAQITSLGLKANNLKAFLRQTALMIADCLQVDICRIVEKRDKLILQAFVHSGQVISPIFNATQEAQVAYTLAHNTVTSVECFSQETRFLISPSFQLRHIQSAVCLPLGIESQIFGTLEVATVQQRSFHPYEMEFLAVCVSCLTGVIQRIQSEASRMESPEVVQEAGQGVWRYDDETGQILWNKTLYRMLGYAEATFLPTLDRVVSLIHPADYPAIWAAVQGCSANNDSVELEGRVLDVLGEYRYLHCEIHSVMGRQQRIGREGRIRDITQLKQYELRLEESESRFHAIGDASPLMVWMTGENGVLTYYSAGFHAYLGVQVDNLSELNWAELAHPEDYQATFQAYIEAFNKRACYQTECRLKRYDGQYRWFYGVGNPSYAKDGTFLGYVGCYVDIDEIKQAEQAVQTYAEKLRLSNHELEEFAFIASHDLQEPLRKVLILGDMLQMSVGSQLSAEGQDYINRIKLSITRMQTLVDDLLQLARVNIAARQFRPVNLKSVLDEVLLDLDTTLNAYGGMVTVMNSVTVEADQTQMHQLFQNLVSNALKYHRSSLPPRVIIDMRNMDGMCEITVQDNGIGFDQRYAERIFRPFERLNSLVEYPGNGMGLAIAKKIVERHSGSIVAKGQPGQGAAFTIRLPLRQPI